MPCHEIDMVEEVGKKKINYSQKRKILLVWEILDNFFKKIYFVNNSLLKVRIKKSFRARVTNHYNFLQHIIFRFYPIDFLVEYRIPFPILRFLCVYGIT